MIKISVIIPVYNVEKYLIQCLDSVINQTYKNLEIICIDDCSTDNSYSILQEYAKTDERIKIFQNEKNLKVGETRNKGLKIATGDYVHFLDSDDFLNINAYQTIVNTISNVGWVEIIHFQNKFIDRNEEFIPNNYMANVSNKIINVYNTPDLVLEWNIAPWGKLIRRDFLINNQIFFNDYPYTEDVEPSIKALVTATSIYFINEVLYSYRINR